MTGQQERNIQRAAEAIAAALKVAAAGDDLDAPWLDLEELERAQIDGRVNLLDLARAAIAAAYPPEGPALNKYQQYITLHGRPGDGVHLVLTDELVRAGIVRVPEQLPAGIPVHTLPVTARLRVARYRRQTKYAGAAASCEVRAWTEWHFDGWEQ